MTRLGLCAALLVFSASNLLAQVTVEVKLPQEQFLPSESLVAAVRITNRSGQELHLGAEDDWLTFSVESRSGGSVIKIGDAPVVGEFDLESSKVATKRVDLAPYFTLGQMGRYAITATVRIKNWGREISSGPKTFDIIRGASLQQFEFGLPASSGVTNRTPEVRKFILEQANYLKGQIRLYLRLTDSTEARTFRVTPIGQMVSMSRPEAQLDKWSNLHVLYANGPHSFSYTVFSPDGELVARQTFDYVTSRPRLRADFGDKISVAGGVRRVSANDLPPNQPAAAEEKAKP